LIGNAALYGLLVTLCLFFWRIFMKKSIEHEMKYDLTGCFEACLPTCVTWADEFESPTGMGVVMDRFQVEEQFFEEVVQAYRNMRPHLLKCCAYTVPELLGSEYFYGLSTFQKGIARICVRHMAGLDEAEFYLCTEEDDASTEYMVDLE
jgi:hypothetical protein